MSLPIGITDPRVVKAYSHPLRIRIHALLDHRVASPSEIARELDLPLATAAYHVRRLLALGLIELVQQRVRRGAIEHRYTACRHLVIDDEEWGAIPEVTKRRYMSEAITLGWMHAATAAEEGGFNRPDIHFSRIYGRVDEAGWKALSEVLRSTLSEVEQVIAESEERTSKDSSESNGTTVILMHFAGPSSDPAAKGAEMDRVLQTTAASIHAGDSGSSDGAGPDTDGNAARPG